MKLFTTLSYAALLSCLGACGGGGDDKPEPPRSYLVEYSVTGASIGRTAFATYASANGVTEQKDIVLPGSIVRFSSVAGDFLYISAQNQTSAGSVSVAIKVNGVTWKSATSSAAYGIASASGTCC